jgi:hypothetical protein
MITVRSKISYKACKKTITEIGEASFIFEAKTVFREQVNIWVLKGEGEGEVKSRNLEIYFLFVCNLLCQN